MQAKINGKTVTFEVPNLTLPDYLRSVGLHPQAVAVEYNGEVIPKERYEAVTIQDGDTLEIVRFVGGGI